MNSFVPTRPGTVMRGTFSLPTTAMARSPTVSGVVGLDFRDDSRAFVSPTWTATADSSGLKNRTAPQIRILRSRWTAWAIRSRCACAGEKSNRDAIGAAVTSKRGALRQTKYLQAGFRVLSQHTKELFFGIGKNEGPVKVPVRWPSGLTQTFEDLPINQRIEIEEGAPNFKAKPFAESPTSMGLAGAAPNPETFPRPWKLG